MTELEIFANFEQHRSFFFSKFLSKIDITDNFDQNRGISKIFPRIEIFKDFDQNRYFPKILT